MTVMKGIGNFKEENVNEASSWAFSEKNAEEPRGLPIDELFISVMTYRSYLSPQELESLLGKSGYDELVKSMNRTAITGFLTHLWNLGQSVLSPRFATSVVIGQHIAHNSLRWRFLHNIRCVFTAIGLACPHVSHGHEGPYSVG